MFVWLFSFSQILQFNDILNTIFSSPPTVAIIVGTLIDNTLEAKRTASERGLPWLVPFQRRNGDSRNDEFYSLPMRFHEYIPSIPLPTFNRRPHIWPSPHLTVPDCKLVMYTMTRILVNFVWCKARRFLNIEETMSPKVSLYGLIYFDSLTVSTKSWFINKCGHILKKN